MSLAALNIIPAPSFSTLNTQWWQPDPALQRWIQCLWTTSIQTTSTILSPDKLYPDAGASLIIEFNDQQAECFYFYNTETTRHLWSPHLNRLSVRLKPGAIAQLLHPDFLEMTNVLVPLDDRILPGIGHLLESLLQQTFECQVQTVQAWLLNRASSLPKEDSKITRLVSQLHDQVINPCTFAVDHGMSRRTLERNLRREMGVSPKQLHEFNRIRKARQLLIRTPLALSDVTLEAGYYDQAHFTNVFHASTMETPAQYRQRKMSQFSKAE